MELLLIFTFIENKFTAISVSFMGLLEKASQDSFFFLQNLKEDFI